MGHGSCFLCLVHVDALVVAVELVARASVVTCVCWTSARWTPMGRRINDLARLAQGCLACPGAGTGNTVDVSRLVGRYRDEAGESPDAVMQAAARHRCVSTERQK